mmetsp:Transcript_47986/g.138939  ORF Transcript_47986/g.138939 Transcript_47986/m.138939 type:complete len:366 (-) Transcript_47986:116-1213(-)
MAVALLSLIKHQSGSARRAALHATASGCPVTARCTPLPWGTSPVLLGSRGGSSSSDAGRHRASLFERELQRCADSAAVLRVGSSTQLPFGPSDLDAFLRRLGQLRRMPTAGGDLHGFVAKVRTSLPKCGVEVARSAVFRFAELRCRQAAMVAWPLVMQEAARLDPAGLADCIWAGAVMPKPPPTMAREVASLARLLAPDLRQLPASALFRCTYGLGRLPRTQGLEGFRRAAERAVVAELRHSAAPCFNGSQLVRMSWAFARLGTQQGQLFDALEPHIRNAIPTLADTELQALYNVCTGLGLLDQWQLIYDVERAMEARHDQGATGDPNKAPRRRPFRKKWTRPSLLDPVTLAGRGNLTGRKVARR